MKKFLINLAITFVFYMIAEIMGSVVNKDWIVFEAFMIGTISTLLHGEYEKYGNE